MSGEEEGVCEFDLVFALGRYGSCDAVEDCFVGPRNDLDCDGIFWSRRSRSQLLAGSICHGPGRVAIRVALSFRHILWLRWKFWGRRKKVHER